MKLKGTRTEQAYRIELQRGYDYIFNSEKGEFIQKCIEQVIGHFITAYILNWIPEQDADFYTLLVDGESIVDIELEYEQLSITQQKTNPKLVDSTTYPIKDYMKSLSKAAQIKVAVAIDLSGRNIHPRS